MIIINIFVKGDYEKLKKNKNEINKIFFNSNKKSKT